MSETASVQDPQKPEIVPIQQETKELHIAESGTVEPIAAGEVETNEGVSVTPTKKQRVKQQRTAKQLEQLEKARQAKRQKRLVQTEATSLESLFTKEREQWRNSFDEFSRGLRDDIQKLGSEWNSFQQRQVAPPPEPVAVTETIVPTPIAAENPVGRVQEQIRASNPYPEMAQMFRNGPTRVHF